MEKAIIYCSVALLALAAAGVYTDLYSSFSPEDRPDSGIETRKNLLNLSMQESASIADYAQLADNKSTNNTVKRLARQLQSTHQQMLQDLQAYADQNGIEIPCVTAGNCRKKATLQENNFNRNWQQQELQLLEQMQRSFEQSASIITDPDLVNWIQQRLPLINNEISLLKLYHE